MRPAITLQQPWASLIVSGGKTLETRSWAPPANLIGRRLAIHAGKTLRKLDDAVAAAAAEVLGLTPSEWSNLPRGAVLGMARLAGAYQVEGYTSDQLTLGRAIPGSPKRNSWQLRERDDAFGDVGEGRWIWVLEDVDRFVRPRPATGRLKIWWW